jgi:hypothetical protein
MTGEKMRRQSLTTADLEVIDKALTTEIKITLGAADEDKDEAVTNAAPLFAVREKIVGMKGKANGPVDRTPRATRTRRTRPAAITMDEA